MRTSALAASRLSLLLLLLQSPPAAPGQNTQEGIAIHVAPTGRDTWSGDLPAPNAEKTDGPRASLAAARDQIRQRKAAGRQGPFTVVVHAGTYCLHETLKLSAEDSGLREAPVIYRAAEGARPTLIGGRRVKGFVPHRGKILKADLAAQGLGGLEFRQLFAAGRRQHLARYPNYDPENPYTGGWAYVEGKPVSLWAKVPGEDKRTLKIKPEDLRDWSNPEEAEVLVFPRYNWWNNILRIESLDREDRVARLAGSASYEIRPGDRYFIRNLKEELDAPGEWYLDRKTSTLYFWPPKPEDAEEVYVPALETLVDLQGAAHVVFRGLALECCDGTAVALADCTACRVEGCTIRNTGGQCSSGIAAVAVRGGSECRVFGCDICQVGSHAVTLAGGDRKTLTPAGHVAENNYIHHTGVYYKQGVGVALSGVGNRAAHNLIHDCPRFAILHSGNDQVIEYNHARHLTLETADTGAIYSGGRDWLSPRGTVIRYNFFHDMYGYGREDGHWVSPHYAWGIYLDDNSAEVRVEGNIVARAIRGLLHFHCARDCTIENNVFIDGTLQQIEMNGWNDYSKFIDRMAPAYEEFIELPAWKKFPGFQQGGHPRDAVPMAGNRLARNIVTYRDPDARLYRFRRLRLDHFACDKNLVWHGGRPLEIAVQEIGEDTPVEEHWSRWQELGFDRDSLVADPLFVDPARDDYRLRPESPAFKLGFKPIPVEQIGPYEHPLRATWPIVEAPGARELAPRIEPGKR